MEANSPYTVLARRYRSQDFDELVGQESIARTLTNAIATGRVAHAYLFTGTRGVGKTSTARIFAKALNATPDLRQADEIAAAIMRGEDLDVIEIDAASNNSVDNARELIANAGIMPARSRWKIYIIDEVHMLSTAAFNALLKTMEEPPPHVKFILCTTETHKVPATIQSRCQRFDFRSIPTQKIAEHLKQVLKGEKLSADPAVIQHIARLGNGSMRDALSIMDRLLAAGESKLTMELLDQMLGLPDQSLIHNLVQAIVDADTAAALLAGNELLSRGTSVEQALDLLTAYFRDLMVISACGEKTDLVDLADEALARAKTHAAAFDTPAIVHMIAVCDATGRSAARSPVARAQFDAAIARLCMTQQLADIPALLRGDSPPPATAPARKGSSAAASPPASPAAPAKPDAALKKKALEPVADRPPLGTPALRAGSSPDTPALRAGSSADLPPDADGPAIWQHVLDHAPRMTRPLIEHMQLIDFDGRTLQLRMSPEGAPHLKWFRGDPAKLTQIVQTATGRRISAVLKLEDNPDTDSAPPPPSDLIDRVRSSPAVRAAMELFDAKIISVTPIEPSPSPALHPAAAAATD